MRKRLPSPIRAVLFDWNGTLLDDLQNALAGWNATFRLLGVKPIALAEFRRTYRLPWQTFYRRRGVNARTLRERARMIDRANFREYRRLPVRLAPGARALIKRLKNRGVILGILSDNQQREIVKLLKRWRLRRHFTFIGTSEQFPPKPSPAGIFAFLKHCRCQPTQAIFVGDLADDIRAGKAAGVTTVAYLNGWQTATKLKKAKPRHTIRKLRELLDLI